MLKHLILLDKPRANQEGCDIQIHFGSALSHSMNVLGIVPARAVHLPKGQLLHSTVKDSNHAFSLICNLF
jgi:hypothetical protein